MSAMISHQGETHPDAAEDAVSKLVPPRIAFVEAVGSAETRLRIRRQGTNLPIQIPLRESAPSVPLRRLVPWFERFAHAFEPFDELIVDIRIDTRRIALPGNYEDALGLFATETALEIVRRFEKRELSDLEFMVLLQMPRLKTFVFHPQAEPLDVREIPLSLSHWFVGVEAFSVEGKFSLPSAHQRLELERRLRALSEDA